MQNEEFYRRCRYIVDRCDPTRLHYLQLLIEHKQRRQCSLEFLPGNLYEKIFKNLDVSTLMNLSASNWFWRGMLTNNDRFWEEYATSIQKTEFSNSDAKGIERYKGEVEVANNWRALRCKSIIVELEGGNEEKVVTCLELDKGRVYVGCDDGTVRVHCATLGDQVQMLAGHRGGVWCLKVQGDVVVTGSTDRSIGIWCTKSGRKRGELIGHGSTVRCIDLFEKWVVSGSRDGTVRLWDWATCECLAVFSGHTDSVRAVRIVPLEDDLLVISGSYDCTVRVWSLKRNELLHLLRGHTGRVYSLAVVDGFVYSTGQDGQVLQWQLSSGDLIKRFDEYGSGLIGMLSSCSGIVAAGCINGTLSVFEPSSSLSLLLAGSGPSITALAMNRRFIVAGSEAGVKLYEWKRQRYCGMPLERADNLWQLVCSESVLVAAYQLNGSTKLAFFNFSACHASSTNSMEMDYEMK